MRSADALPFMASSLTLILGAVPWEIKPIIAALTGRRTALLEKFPYHSGRIGRQQVVVAITGVGKTNAAMIATLFLTKLRPARLLYTGSAARLNGALRTGDVIIGKRTFHHDAGSSQVDGMKYRKIIGPRAGEPTHYRFQSDRELCDTAIAAAKSYVPKTVTANGSTYVPDVRGGDICSGDVFGMTAEKISDIRAKLGCDLVEMEGAAIAQVSQSLGVPHLVIRGGSNLAQPDPGQHYKALGQIAARQAAFFTLHLVQALA